MQRILVLLIGACLLAAACALPVGWNQSTALGAPPSQSIRLPYPTLDGESTQNVGDLYLPSHVQGQAPLIVLFHGGAWRSHIARSSTSRLARTLTEHGFAVYNVEYRRIGAGGSWRKTLDDAAAAADFATALSVLYPQVSRSVFLVGHSSGGQLAVWAAQHMRLRPAAVIAISAPLALTVAARNGDRNVAAFLGGSPDQQPQRYSSADPAAIGCPRVPIVAVHGTADRTVPISNVRAFMSRVRCPGARVRLVEVPGANHIALISPRSPAFSTTLNVIETTTRRWR
ncbi:alpha/beta fold hydrolase [Gordonia sp. X0973]|uniref:alpha/beta hydrolase family protein n=1 Tax=Gordonia sp. X0973 TaxID=2742602 RepID=UPI0013ECAE84|nr:alpha/beta fold hydrolase [Gordonia sp. X0973]QKT06555.1 alpha/beta fold hydrolase [Gordonia sp. X0973]